MKMLRLALVLPAFVLLLAASGAARAETFFASLEKSPPPAPSDPRAGPNPDLLAHKVPLQHSPQALQPRPLSPPKTNNGANRIPAQTYP